MLLSKKYHLPSIIGYTISIVLFIGWISIFPVQKEMNTLWGSLSQALHETFYFISAIQLFIGSLLAVSLLGILLGKLTKNNLLVRTWTRLLGATIGLIAMLILIACIAS